MRPVIVLVAIWGAGEDYKSASDSGAFRVEDDDVVGGIALSYLFYATEPLLDLGSFAATCGPSSRLTTLCVCENLVCPSGGFTLWILLILAAFLACCL